MKLNPDCIRDILLTVESIPDLNHHYDFNEKTIPDFFPQYTFDEVMYHIRQCHLNDFFVDASPSWGFSCYTVYDLSPKGHEFLANIRNDTFFNKVKAICKELGLSSLNDISQVAINSAALLIKSYFHLP